jgi:tetratricopeptide (TPR) repeat protein
MKNLRNLLTLIFLISIFQTSKAENLTERLRKTIEKQGIQKGISLYKLLKNDINFKLLEKTLDDLGYQLLNDGNTKEAIKIFKLNQKEFPHSEVANASLASAYTVFGQVYKARRYFDKSLKVNALNVQSETLGNQKSGFVTFRLTGFENAEKVALIGNFNHFQNDKNLFHKTEDGVWECKIKLPKGTFYYQFLIDNNLTINDPGNRISFQPLADWNSVVVVN